MARPIVRKPGKRKSRILLSGGNPPGVSRHAEVRYLDVRENDLDEGQAAAWIRQAAALPGGGKS